MNGDRAQVCVFDLVLVIHDAPFFSLYKTYAYNDATYRPYLYTFFESRKKEAIADTTRLAHSFRPAIISNR